MSKSESAFIAAVGNRARRTAGFWAVYAFRLLKATINDLRRNPPGMQAAALAYYTAFSLGPILLLLVRGLGWLMGESDARRRILSELYYYAGPDLADTIKSVLDQVSRTDGALATLVAIGTLGFAASRVFTALQTTLNHAWGIPHHAGPDRSNRIRKRVISFLMVAGAGLLFTTSMLISAALGAIERWFEGLLPDLNLFQIANSLVSFALITVVFAAIYRYVPDAPVRWADVWIGAVTASMLFALGRMVLGLYFDWSALGGAYVAAGSLLAVLVWLHFSAIILLVGARITRIHAEFQDAQADPASSDEPDRRKADVTTTREPLHVDSQGGKSHGPS